jgi:hypothetical protein
MEQDVLPQLHWNTKLDELLDEAGKTPDGALCVFMVDEQIPVTARGGFAALVMAYTREAEPVAVLEDGTAVLLTIEAGEVGGSAVAARVFAQLDKLRLRQTVRAGVATLGSGSAQQTLGRAKSAATQSKSGEVSAA